MKISVIIPVYNVAPYLGECLGSVVAAAAKAQGRSVEIICVDDGSTDGCAQLLDTFARDARLPVKVLHQSNGGLSAARNAGLEFVFASADRHGEDHWITFVDGDDAVAADYFLGFTRVDDRECYWLTDARASVAWGKMWPASAWRQERFPVGRVHEDEFVIHKAVFESETFLANSAGYRYRSRPGSIMTRRDDRFYQDWIDGFRAQADYFKSRSRAAYAQAMSRMLQVEAWRGRTDLKDVHEYAQAQGPRLGGYYWAEHARHPWLVNRLTWQLVKAVRGFTVRVLLVALGLAFVVWAVCAWFGVGDQRSLFYERGQEEMYDYWMPRMCVEQGYSPAKSADYGIDPRVGGVRACDKPVGEIVEFSDWYPSVTGLRFVTGDMDKVYPALALLPYKLFPATRAGSWWFSSVCAVVFLLSLFLVGGRRSPCGVSPRTEKKVAFRNFSFFIFHFSFVFSMPFLFALERGNPIWPSAAAVGVFLAWWDDEVRWKRTVAALCLAFAAVMKIAPAALGLVYLLGGESGDGRKRPLVSLAYTREIVIAAVAAVILFLVPWLFVKEGFAAIPIMMKNAAHHADFVLRTSDFGLVQPWRAVRVALGLDVRGPWPGMYFAARLSQLFGLVSLFVGARRRDYLLLVGGMLLAAGNMYYYAALYLFPVFILSTSISTSTSSLSSTSISTSSLYSPSTSSLHLLLWFLVFCPLQFVLLGHSANAIICNLAVMTLMATEALSRGYGSRISRSTL